MTEEELLAEMRQPDTEIRRPLHAAGWTLFRDNKPVLTTFIDQEMVWTAVSKGLLNSKVPKNGLDFVLVMEPSTFHKWMKIKKIARLISQLTTDDLNIDTSEDKPNEMWTVHIIRMAAAEFRTHGLDEWLKVGPGMLGGHREKEKW